jgi:hypothetical protein
MKRKYYPYSNKGGGKQRRQWQRWQEQWRGQQGWRVSNSNKGDGNEGGEQVAAMRATATATAMVVVAMWAMAMATRLVGNKESKGKGGKGNHNGNKGGR